MISYVSTYFRYLIQWPIESVGIAGRMAPAAGLFLLPYHGVVDSNDVRWGGLASRYVAWPFDHGATIRATEQRPLDPSSMG